MQDTKYTYHIDLNERGTFKAHVENTKGKYVFVIDIPCWDDDTESNIFLDGFMKHDEDISGLERYLKQLGIMKENYELVRGIDY
jgi:hypothetical protein